MLLLTWHGTLACLPGDGSGIVHLPLPLAAGAPAPLEIDMDAVPPQGGKLAHPGLGPIAVAPGPSRRGICLSRFGRFLCAEAHAPIMQFDRKGAADWETFLPISPDGLALLQHILTHRWIVRQTRAVIPRSAIRLDEGFVLLLGKRQLDLTTGWPEAVQTLESTARPGEMASEFMLRQGGEPLTIVAAQPRGSLLLTSQEWPVRSRATAEMLALAVHRSVACVEPEQAAFEADAAFLEAGGGAAALSDLLEQKDWAALAAERAASGQGDASPMQKVAVLAGPPGLAAILRRHGQPVAVAPEGRYARAPASMRDWLERFLAPPADGEASLDEDADAAEFRAFLASGEAKLFVQLGDAFPGSRREFEATAALLDRLTRHASLLHIAVSGPDRRLPMPSISLQARTGAHAFYRMQPVSQLDEAGFDDPGDAALLGQVIASHAASPPALGLIPPRDRDIVGRAMSQFGVASLPEDTANAEAACMALVDQANASLTRFLAAARLPRRFRFAALAREQKGGDRLHGAFKITLGAQQAVFGFEIDRSNVGALLHRSLALVYLLDAVFAAGPLPDLQFRADFADQGRHPHDVSFCSHHEGSCLLPDADFVATAGYDTLRRQMAAAPQDWRACRDVIFWRGSTTGLRRHAPPAEGVEDFTWLPRLDLCKRASLSRLAKHFDVGISKIGQIREAHVVEQIKASGLCRPGVDRSGFLGHKGILVIDGNSNAWSALFNALLTGACVFKVASPRGFRQWYYDALQPWVHFVPVAEDFSDLDERAAWLLAHDDEARAIGEAGRDLAVSMTFESVMENAAVRLRSWLLESPGVKRRPLTPARI